MAIGKGLKTLDEESEVLDSKVRALYYSVTLTKTLNLSGPQFSYLSSVNWA
jgi:hypothetical protein